MSSFVHQRNTHRHAGNTLKRPFDNPGGYGGRIGGFQEEDRSRYAPAPQKRPRYQTQPQFQSGTPPLYNRRHQHDSNLSRVSNYGDVINSNSSNISTFAHRNSQSNADYYQKPYGYGNPNPQSVPLPLPYRKLDGFDSLPEWVPNLAPNTNREITGVRFNANQVSQPPVFTNLPNSMPLTHSNVVSVVSQSLLPQQPIVSKELADLLSVLNNKENEKEKECDLGLDFDKINLNVRRESVVKSLYSDMPRQCSSCGVRFKCQEEHSKHMDWHVRKNRMAKDATKAMTTRVSQKPKKSRDWFASSSLWLSAATGAAVEGAKPAFGETQKTKEEEKQQQHMVHADENQKMCALCLESLEEFFSHEEDDWMYRDAVYLHMNGSGPIAHVKCMPEPRKAPAKESTKPVMVARSAVVC